MQLGDNSKTCSVVKQTRTQGGTPVCPVCCVMASSLGQRYEAGEIHIVLRFSLALLLTEGKCILFYECTEKRLKKKKTDMEEQQQSV